MNLVIAAPSFPTAQSPTNLYVVEQAKALQRRGHSILFLHLEQRRAGTRSSPTAGVQETAFGFPMLHVSYPALRGASFLPSVVALTRALRQVRHTFVPALIHAHFVLPVGFAAVMVGRLLGLPVVITEHSGPLADLRHTWIARWTMDAALRGAARVIAVSEHLKQELRAVVGQDLTVQVIPNLVDTDIFYPAAAEDAPGHSIEILYVGRGGDTRKGNEVALRAFAQAAAQSPYALNLVVAGPGLDAELQPMAEQLGIAPRVEFVGALMPHAMAAQMRRCRFVISASRYETFGLVLLEAMACGKPVIATRCGGPEELVTPETGRLVPVDNVDALAGEIVQMADQWQTYDAHHIAAFASDHFRADTVAAQLEQVYRTVVAMPRSKKTNTLPVVP